MAGYFCLCIQLKCPFGQCSKPIFEHGLHDKPSTSAITIWLGNSGINGDIPNAGIVFPQTETIGLLNADAMCISPVSAVKTALHSRNNTAEAPKEVLPHKSSTLLPTYCAISAPIDISDFPPSNTTGDSIFLHSVIRCSTGICLVPFNAPQTIATKPF